jgi:hypothetical protein
MMQRAVGGELARSSHPPRLGPVSRLDREPGTGAEGFFYRPEVGEIPGAPQQLHHDLVADGDPAVLERR